MVFEGVSSIYWVMIAIIIGIGFFQRWRIRRKARKVQETIDVFELTDFYRKAYSRAYISEEDGISLQEYNAVAQRSEEIYRVQMEGYLQHNFSYKQMSAAINQRNVNSFYDGEDILSGMMQAAKNKAVENIKYVKKTLSPNGRDIDVPTRKRRRR